MRIREIVGGDDLDVPIAEESHSRVTDVASRPDVEAVEVARVDVVLYDAFKKLFWPRSLHCVPK
jgi:hypothetical protein